METSKYYTNVLSALGTQNYDNVLVAVQDTLAKVSVTQTAAYKGFDNVTLLKLGLYDNSIKPYFSAKEEKYLVLEKTKKFLDDLGYNVLESLLIKDRFVVESKKRKVLNNEFNDLEPKNRKKKTIKQVDKNIILNRKMLFKVDKNDNLFGNIDSAVTALYAYSYDKIKPDFDSSFAIKGKFFKKVAKSHQKELKNLIALVSTMELSRNVMPAEIYRKTEISLSLQMIAVMNYLCEKGEKNESFKDDLVSEISTKSQGIIYDSYKTLGLNADELKLAYDKLGIKIAKTSSNMKDYIMGSQKSIEVIPHMSSEEETEWLPAKKASSESSNKPETKSDKPILTAQFDTELNKDPAYVAYRNASPSGGQLPPNVKSQLPTYDVVRRAEEYEKTVEVAKEDTHKAPNDAATKKDLADNKAPVDQKKPTLEGAVSPKAKSSPEINSSKKTEKPSGKAVSTKERETTEDDENNANIPC